MKVANEVTPNPEDSTPNSKKNQQPAWNTEQNLVLISGCIKYETISVVGRNQKSETYWAKIVQYCNEHCSFDPPGDGVACRNDVNYMKTKLDKWVGAYDGAKRLQDAIDEYIKIGATKALECLRRFCKGIIRLYEQVYLRAPTQDDLQRILHVSEMRGFLWMIGSIDCMHWEWKNCPKAWECQFTRGDKGITIVIPEAVLSHDLRICHSFFGCLETLKDINVLDRSSVFDDVEHEKAPSVNFFVNQCPYNLAYYLVDCIYPSYSTFIKSIRLPQSEPDKLFSKFQEGCRKDIERAFGVLQARFKIIREAARLWDIIAPDLKTL